MRCHYLRSVSLLNTTRGHLNKMGDTCAVQLSGQRVLHFVVFIIISIVSQHIFADTPFTFDETQLNIDTFIDMSTTSPRRSEIIEFSLYGKLHPGQHIYSVETQHIDGPEPTYLIFSSNPFKEVSKLQESPVTLLYDESFEIRLKAHINEFWLRQSFVVPSTLTAGSYALSGYLLYQVCSQKICSLQRKNHFHTVIDVLPE